MGIFRYIKHLRFLILSGPAIGPFAVKGQNIHLPDFPRYSLSSAAGGVGEVQLGAGFPADRLLTAIRQFRCDGKGSVALVTWGLSTRPAQGAVGVRGR